MIKGKVFVKLESTKHPVISFRQEVMWTAEIKYRKAVKNHHHLCDWGRGEYGKEWEWGKKEKVR